MKKKDRIWIYTFVALGFILVITNSCKKEEPKIIKQKVTGLVQKGPYIIGTSISMYELSQTLEQTGKIFTTQISDNSGSFEIDNVSLTSNYVEFSSSGYYFDEVKGDISLAPLNLNAISDISNISTINVNILTHLEKLRVEYLVKQDKTFSEAKKIAQSEILAIFGFSLSDIDNSETLDISINNESNAILLAISIILQGNRSIGDLSELLANISNDIREDGILNSEIIKTSLRNSTKELVINAIRTNLVKRYENLGVSALIPDFEKYINVFLEFTGKEPVTFTQPATNISVTGATLNGIVNANSINTSVTFEYGTTTNYGSTVNAAQGSITGNSNVSVNSSLDGLLPGATYHFRIKTENTKGIAYGEDLSFTTLGQIPIVTTIAASKITPVSVQLNGIVNANYLSTSVTFEYGPTTTYGSTVIAVPNQVTGNSNSNIYAAITGLTPGTIYHFRVKAINTMGTNYSSEMTFTTTTAYSIGDTYQGGIVFFITGTYPNQHGFVCAPTDQSAGAQWGCSGTLITGADGTAIGTGNQNTIDIVNNCATIGIAAQICYDLDLNNYTDWFLPSKDELGLLYSNLKANNLGDFTGDYYWSSSESSIYFAWRYNFVDGLSYIWDKVRTPAYCSVRAVRAF